jgi:hypothetical protein
MGPKVESVLRFLSNGGREAIVTSSENLCRAVAGSAGTHILAEDTGQSIQAKLQLALPVGGR